MWISLMVLLAFAWGLWRIFDTRLQRGGEHAPYSTFSSQPRGARACLDALDGLRRIECRRNLVPLTRFKGAPTATVVFAGAASTFFSEDTAENFEKVEGWLEDGMEVVATMDTRALERRSFDGKKAYLNPWDIFDDGVEADPDSTDAKRKSPRRSPGLKRLLRGEISPGGDGGPASGKGKEGKEGKEDSTGAGEDEEDAQVTLAERWNFKFRYQEASEKDIQSGWPVSLASPAGGMEAPQWHSAWSFEAPADLWKPLASQGGRPVIVRRSFGKGGVTLVSDSTFLTNEALVRAPAPGFLIWLLGSRDLVIFDETMHGNAEDPGVVTLMRRHGLTGFFAGLALFLALLIWRSASSLIPPPDHDLGPDGAVAGAAGSSGLVNLLQQAVPPATLIPACFQEWAKSPEIRRRYPDAVVQTAGAIAAEKPARGRPVAEIYRRIVDYLGSTRG